MILYFISALLISLTLIQLGSYATIISLFSTGAKVLLALMFIAILVLLYRRFKQSKRILKLPRRSD